jgi:hypothetical protein
MSARCYGARAEASAPHPGMTGCGEPQPAPTTDGRTHHPASPHAGWDKEGRNQMSAVPLHRPTLALLLNRSSSTPSPAGVTLRSPIAPELSVPLTQRYEAKSSSCPMHSGHIRSMLYGGVVVMAGSGRSTGVPFQDSSRTLTLCGASAAMPASCRTGGSMKPTQGNRVDCILQRVDRL